MAKKKLRLKKKVKQNLIKFFSILCAIGIIYSCINIIDWKMDGDKVKGIIENAQEIANVKEIEDSENVEIVEPQEPIEQSEPVEETEERNLYWDYIKMNLIDVDFKDLIETNKDTVGWIQVNGTNVNYPFVQTDNNSYYLTHDFEKNKNSAGWVFLDYRNNKDFTDANTIIYAHGRYDKTMFGTLRDALTNGWLSNRNNFVFKISTPKENSLWQIFSIYHIPETSDYLYTNFNTDEEYNNFINMIRDRSAHKFNADVSSKDRIITLSTCYNDTERLVLHAKLIKYEKKY